MRKKYYLTLDTETATLPFANELCKTASEKQKIAIAKPLVYDIAWTITDRQGNILKKENYLIQETFFVPTVFNTAYYKDKRPIYIQLLKDNLIKVDTWQNVVDILIEDLKICDIATAYNACFDFKKAIPFTEKYINALYSETYNTWEKEQKKHCQQILKGTDKSTNEDYLRPYCTLKDYTFPIADLWGIACKRLINIDKYRNYCLENMLLTASIMYFKTSAETSFQYLMKQHDFIEEHTALSDSEIEAKILTKALKKGKIEPELTAFPFKELGTTTDYVTHKKPKYKEKVITALREYITENNGFEKVNNGYWSKIVDTYNTLTAGS